MKEPPLIKISLYAINYSKIMTICRVKDCESGLIQGNGVECVVLKVEYALKEAIHSAKHEKRHLCRLGVSCVVL